MRWILRRSGLYRLTVHGHPNKKGDYQTEAKRFHIQVLLGLIWLSVPFAGEALGGHLQADLVDSLQA